MSMRGGADGFVAGIGAKSGKAELLNGRAVSYGEDSLGENMLRGDLFFAFKKAVEQIGIACNVYTFGALVRINDYTVRMPDSIVQTAGFGRARVVAAPMIVTDIKFDHVNKGDMQQRLQDYFSVEAVKHYVVVDRARGLVLHHERGTGPSILTRIVRGGSIIFDGFEVPSDAILGKSNP